MTRVAHPSVLLVVVAAAGLADEELAVETLAPGVEQELVGLQTPDAVRLGQAGLVAEKLPLGIFSLDFVLQVPETVWSLGVVMCVLLTKTMRDSLFMICD